MTGFPGPEKILVKSGENTWADIVYLERRQSHGYRAEPEVIDRAIAVLFDVCERGEIRGTQQSHSNFFWNTFIWVITLIDGDQLPFRII